MKRILVINPGSTSTKTAVFEDERAVWMAGGHHPADETAAFGNIMAQYDYRRDYIVSNMEAGGVEMNFDAVIGRGGLLKPLKGGVYRVNERMKNDLRNAADEHACNLGALIADEIAAHCNCPAFIADPVTVDEMRDEARLTGVPDIRRKSVFHALNSKAVARKYAAATARRYEDLNLIVAHLGGGISVGAHAKGQVTDVNNALDGEGPFSPERAGTLPAGQLVDLCFDGHYSRKQIKAMICGRGGLVAHLGTNDMITVARHAEDGEQPWLQVLEAMLYTVAKQIGAMHVALGGRTDAIILTGGIAHSAFCMDMLRRQTEFLAPVAVMPGEGEMESLAYNALGALNGELPVYEYV